MIPPVERLKRVKLPKMFALRAHFLQGFNIFKFHIVSLGVIHVILQNQDFGIQVSDAKAALPHSSSPPKTMFFHYFGTDNPLLWSYPMVPIVGFVFWVAGWAGKSYRQSTNPSKSLDFDRKSMKSAKINILPKPTELK